MFREKLKIWWMYATVFTVVFVLVFSTFTVPNTAFAANVLTNPSFTGGSTGWTLNVTTYDSAYYQDSAGSVKTATPVGRNQVATGDASQTIGTTINSTDTVLLSHYWSKQCVNVDCATQDIRVEIAKPSAPTTWVAIWSDATSPAFGAATAWAGPSGLDVSSFFDESGQYNIRLYANLKGGNHPSGQALTWFDNVILDVTGAAPADLSWDTGAADFEIWAGATATTDASLTWDNGTLICSTSLNDDDTRTSTCGSINKNQTYRVQTVLKNIGGAAVSMASGDFVDQVNVQTYWAGTTATLTDCGFADGATFGGSNDDTSPVCVVAYNATNNVRITQTTGEVLIAATTGKEGFMYRITTDDDVSLSNSSTYWNASIDSIIENSSRITIGQKRTPGLFIRGLIKIRGLVKFR